MPREVKSKLRDVWTNFLNETSIHGLQYLVGKSHKKIGTRICWFLSFGTAFGFLIFNLYSNVEAYISFDHETKTSLSFVSEMTFPAVSFCNAHSFDKRKVNQSDNLYQYLKEKFNFRYRDNDYNSSKWNQSQLKTTDLEAISFDPEDIVRFANLPNRRLETSKYFKTSYRDHLESCLTLNAHWFEDNPEPIVLGINEDVKFYNLINQDDYAFYEAEASVSVLIHSPDEPLDVHTPRAVLSPGNSYKLLLSVRNYTYLPYPYNSYMAMNCETDLENKRNLKYFHRYTYKGCLLECLSEYVVNMCSCVTEYIFHNITNNVPHCTPFQREDCVLPITRQFYLDSSNSNNITNACVCPRPCSETKYITELSSGTFPSIGAIDSLIAVNITDSLEHARNNLLRLTVSFRDSMVENVYHEPKMPIKDTVSIIGGLMGFCLGASVLSIIEFMETVFSSIITLMPSFIKKHKGIGPKQTTVTTLK